MSAVKNIKPCPCCGQDRLFPQEPGMWEYCEGINFQDRKWKKVSVIASDEGLCIIPEGETEPVWWPSDAAWRPFNSDKENKS